MSGQLHAPATLTLKKGSLVQLYRRLHEPHGRSGRSDEEKNLSLPKIGSKMLSSKLLKDAHTTMFRQLYWF
jgi:hypothetical protein